VFEQSNCIILYSVNPFLIRVVFIRFLCFIFRSTIALHRNVPNVMLSYAISHLLLPLLRVFEDISIKKKPWRQFNYTLRHSVSTKKKTGINSVVLIAFRSFPRHISAFEPYSLGINIFALDSLSYIPYVNF